MIDAYIYSALGRWGNHRYSWVGGSINAVKGAWVVLRRGCMWCMNQYLLMSSVYYIKVHSYIHTHICTYYGAYILSPCCGCLAGGLVWLGFHAIYNNLSALQYQLLNKL